MATIADIRAQYPQYHDLSDQQLADAIHRKFYSDMPVDQFNAKIGLTPAGPTAAAPAPAGMAPGSRQYADWARDQAVAGKTLPQVSPPPPGTPAADPNALGPNERRGELAPVIRNSLTGALRPGWPQMALDIGNAAVNAFTLPGDVASGKTPIDLNNPSKELIGRGLNFSSMAGSELPLAARGMVGQAVDAGAQKALTNAAIKGAPTASELKSAASQAFEVATGDKPIQITDNAYMRLMGDIQNATQKYRPNELNNPEVVGMLQKFRETADAVNAPGSNVAVDLKDLHILRQGLGDILSSKSSASDQTKKIAGIIVDQLDNFIQGPNGLEASDILGGGDPKKAANALMAGISGWNTANKVGIVEKAIAKADTYKTGVEDGLKSAFTTLMKGNDFNRFSPVEKTAIRDVVKGGLVQNSLSMLGKLGFNVASPGGHNILGGLVGSAASGAALTPFLGPVVGPAVGTAASMAASAAGRAMSEGMATKAATRAAQIVATPNIPIAGPKLVSPFLTSAPSAAGMITGGLLTQRNGGQGW